MATLEQRLAAAVASAEDSAEKLSQIVSGNASTTVEVAVGRAVKSLAKLQADVEATYSSNPVLAATIAARDAAIAARDAARSVHETSITVPTAADDSFLWVPVWFQNGNNNPSVNPLPGSNAFINRLFRYGITQWVDLSVPPWRDDLGRYGWWIDSRSYVEFEFFYSGSTANAGEFHRYTVVAQADSGPGGGGKWAANIARAHGHTSVAGNARGVVVYLRSGRYRVRSLSGPMGNIVLPDFNNPHLVHGVHINVDGTIFSTRPYDAAEATANLN